MIVVDASAVIEVLRNGPRSSQFLTHMTDELIAPDLLVSETLRFLTRRETAGDNVEPARQAFGDMDVSYQPTWPHADRIWELRHNVSSYDAAYLALAEAHSCPLLTADERLARAPGVQTTIVGPWIPAAIRRGHPSTTSTVCP